MTKYTRREIITAGICAISATSGCVGQSGDADGDERDQTETNGNEQATDGPAAFPSESTAFDDRSVALPDGSASYRPVSLVVKDQIPEGAVAGPVPSEWPDRSTFDAFEPSGSVRLVVVRMELTNSAKGPDSAPAVGSQLGVHFADGSSRASTGTVHLVPAETSSVEPWERFDHSAIQDPPDYTLHGSSSSELVDPKETVTGWYVAPAPATLAADEIFPAMGTEPQTNGFPVRWENGYNREIITDA